MLFGDVSTIIIIHHEALPKLTSSQQSQDETMSALRRLDVDYEEVSRVLDL